MKILRARTAYGSLAYRPDNKMVVQFNHKGQFLRFSEIFEVWRLEKVGQTFKEEEVAEGNHPWFWDKLSLDYSDYLKEFPYFKTETVFLNGHNFGTLYYSKVECSMCHITGALCDTVLVLCKGQSILFALEKGRAAQFDLGGDYKGEYECSTQDFINLIAEARR